MVDEKKLEKEIIKILEHAGETQVNFTSNVAVTFITWQIMSAIDRVQKEKETEEFKCDPDLVIHTEPVMIREDRSKPESERRKGKWGALKTLQKMFNGWL